MEHADIADTALLEAAHRTRPFSKAYRVRWTHAIAPET